MIPADDRRIPGWRVLKEYLSVREDKPRLYIARECRTLIHSMQSLLCDANRIEDAANDPHHLTHAPEALRYAVMSRFEFAPSEETDNNFSFFKKKSSLSNYLNY
jgi:hypothetical protein